ncbi:MAG: TenA family protein [Dehalococcoidia bacterium]|nr:TenA family protein [Dehalococcoidia bacterium]MDW8119150.1 TenA family protein [Chloroflexota bacterium]
MGLSDTLRQNYHALWERMVEHPFVQELGRDTLPMLKFQRYFLQDYLFLKSFVTLLSLTVAKAPDFPTKRRLAGFLAQVTDGEEGLFRRAFRQWGISEAQVEATRPHPKVAPYLAFMERIAYNSPFHYQMTLLAVSEWTYLDWAQRVVHRYGLPKTPIYREWVDLHSNPAFTEFVGWLRQRLDALEPSLAPNARQGVAGVFAATLLHEIHFWDAAYEDERA